MSFNPEEKIIKLRGKDYLEVKWRLVWFREDYPEGTISTEVVNVNPPVVRATVFGIDNKVLASGIASATGQGIAKDRPFEKAETAAIGRALAHAGYGTQFTGEEEGEHLADSPVSTNAESTKKSENAVQPARPYSPEQVKAKVDKISGDNASVSVNSNLGAVIASVLDGILGDKTKRYELCKWLVGEPSTKKMIPSDLHAIKTWLGVESFNDVPGEDVITEVRQAHEYALKQAGQQAML